MNSGVNAQQKLHFILLYPMWNWNWQWYFYSL